MNMEKLSQPQDSQSACWYYCKAALAPWDWLWKEATIPGAGRLGPQKEAGGKPLLSNPSLHQDWWQSALSQAGFSDIGPLWVHRAHTWKVPAPSLMLWYCCLDLLNNFKQGAPYFHFALGLANYVGGLAFPESGMRESKLKEELLKVCPAYVRLTVEFFWSLRSLFLELSIRIIIIFYLGL